MACLRAGVIPASFNDQLAAQRLAACNDIGEASYVNSLIATALLDTFVALPTAAAIRRRLAERYAVDFTPDMTGASSLPCCSFKPDFECFFGACLHVDPRRMCPTSRQPVSTQAAAAN
jgi:hypothetical protein